MSLQSLSDSKVLSRLHNLVRQERDVTLLVLEHLNEVERRRLHLKLGYASLFDYCTSKLGYSASAAVRRIRSARCAARFPAAQQMLERNELTISTLSQISRTLTAVNHAELLARVRGQSQREVEVILAEYQPTPLPRDRVRTVVVRVPLPSRVSPPSIDAHRTSTANTAAVADATFMGHTLVATALLSARSTENACEKSTYNRNGCDSEKRPTAAAASASFERRAVVQFTASEAFMAKLERIRSLAGHRLPPDASLEQLFELAMDLMIAKEDPLKRKERREKQRQRATRETSTRADSGRYVSASARDDVLVRDNGHCTFVGPGGHRCSATVTLQVDHRIPVARGGTSVPSNLRILCAHHNRLEAVRLLGEAAASRRRGAGEARKGSGAPVSAP